jgi:hypothetical protein
MNASGRRGAVPHVDAVAVEQQDRAERAIGQVLDEGDQMLRHGPQRLPARDAHQHIARFWPQRGGSQRCSEDAATTPRVLLRAQPTKR